MLERFQFIDKFIPNKDFIDCPVGINKAAILYDRVKHIYVLQVKFENFSGIPVRKVETKVIYQDNKGNVFEAKSSYTGNEKIDSYFGSDKVIELNCDDILKVDIDILKVILEDSTVWEYKQKAKKFLKPQTELLPILKRQIARDFGESISNNFSYLPIDSGEYWQCACGKANEGSVCVKCRQAKEIVFECVNVENIISNLKKYLNFEEEKTADKRKAEQRVIALKNRKIKKVCKLFILIIAVLFMSWTSHKLIDEISFYSAVKNLKNQEYSQAIEKFNLLPREIYEDRVYSELESESENIFNRFQNESIDYEDTCDYLEMIQDYFDVGNVKGINVKLKEAKNLNESRNQFNNGKKYEERGDYVKAINAFKKVIEKDSNYQDAQKYIEKSTNALIQETNLKLKEYKDSNNYKEALQLIDQVDGVIKINNYYEYFCAIRDGENYLKNGVEVGRIRKDLYSLPNHDSKTQYYIKTDWGNSHMTPVYEYHISRNKDLEYEVWMKIKCDEEFYWIIK